MSCCVQRRKLWSKAGQVEAVFRAFLESVGLDDQITSHKTEKEKWQELINTKTPESISMTAFELCFLSTPEHTMYFPPLSFDLLDVD